MRCLNCSTLIRPELQQDDRKHTLCGTCRNIKEIRVEYNYIPNEKIIVRQRKKGAGRPKGTTNSYKIAMQLLDELRRINFNDTPEGI